MPKRSNDFQRLVYLTRRNLADGAVVTESKMMRDRLTKSYREVDVVIKGCVGLHPVVVCIECRDHKRVADVSWVDAMKAKHDRLETNALLLASAAGFTKEAKEVAERYGIELFSLEDQDRGDLKELLGPGGSLWHKTCELGVEKVTALVAKVDDLPPETVRTNPDNLLHSADGSELGQVRQLVDLMVNSDRVRELIVKEATEEHTGFELLWDRPMDSHGQALYMMKLEPRVLRQVERLRVVGPCKIRIGRFELRTARLGKINIAWGKTVLAGQPAIAVATRKPSGETVLSVHVDGPPKGAA